MITMEAPGSHAFPKVSAWPMMRLPASEPLRLPRPPTTTTISAGTRMLARAAGGKANAGAHGGVRGLYRSRYDSREPGQHGPEGEHGREHALDVDPHACGHLGVEDAGANDGAQPRSFDERPERYGHRQPER